MTQTSSASFMARHDSAAAREIAIEHGVLSRQMAALQRRVSEQLRAHAQQIAALEDEVLHLRAQRIVSRTGLLWGLGVPAGLARPPARRAQAVVASALVAMAEASSVICQTGCVGHAHPWLEADGQCRRTGQVCDLYASEISEIAK